MNDILTTWMTDAEAFELQKLYAVQELPEYTFVRRQEDFYITLLNRMFRLLQEVEGANYADHSEELIRIAHSMYIYSEKVSEASFKDIEKNSNALYVATIYYLVRYEAIATLILKDYKIEQFQSRSAQLIFYFVSGARVEDALIEDENKRKLFEELNLSIVSNLQQVKELLKETENKCATSHFEDLDDFFDSYILLHILRKYLNHNVLSTLTGIHPDIEWGEYIRFLKSQYILSFLPSQEDAISKGLLSFEKSFSLKMPTSAGKSYITELVIYQELHTNPHAKILYLAPLRSLSRELEYRFWKVGKALNFRSKAVYGGSNYTIDQRAIKQVQLLISTPETFESIENTLDEQLSSFTLVICDEGQLLNDFSRGVNYEFLLTRLKQIDNIRYLFLSAIIPNIEKVNTWLGGEEFEVGDSQYRPCPILLADFKEEDLIVRDENYESEKYRIKHFIPQIKSLNTKRKISCALALKSLSAGPVLIYTAMRGGFQGCDCIAKDIKDLLSIEIFSNPSSYSTHSEQLKRISDYIAYQLGRTHLLPKIVLNGYAYHHGRLPQDIRSLLEQSYVEGVIPLLICTSTLAEGVNLPVQTMILSCINRYEDGRMRPLDATQLKNIIGRVGRAGRQRFGIVISQEKHNQQSYKNLLSALKGERLSPIMGTLYKVVKCITDYTGVLSDEVLNELLEKYGFSQSIDRMIVRNLGKGSFEEINIESVIKESLAYHVGTEEEKNCLRRIFTVRNRVLSNCFADEDASKFVASGMSAENFNKLEDWVTVESFLAIDTKNPLSDSWIDYTLDVYVELFPSKEYEKDPDKKKSYKNVLRAILVGWIQGLQYVQLATSVGLEVDDVVGLVIADLQNSYHQCIVSLIHHIHSLGTDVSYIEAFPDYIKYGVNSEKKIALIKSGLTDRIVVNIITDSPIMNSAPFGNQGAIKNWIIIFAKEECTKLLEGKEVPSLCIEHFLEYLG
jgi:replicative superfamily II helicase